MDFKRLKRRGYTLGTNIIDFLSAIGICIVTHLKGEGRYAFSVCRVSLAEGIEYIYTSTETYSKDEVEKVAYKKATELC